MRRASPRRPVSSSPRRAPRRPAGAPLARGCVTSTRRLRPHPRLGEHVVERGRRAAPRIRPGRARVRARGGGRDWLPPCSVRCVRAVRRRAPCRMRCAPGAADRRPSERASGPAGRPCARATSPCAPAGCPCAPTGRVCAPAGFPYAPGTRPWAPAGEVRADSMEPVRECRVRSRTSRVRTAGTPGEYGRHPGRVRPAHRERTGPWEVRGAPWPVRMPAWPVRAEARPVRRCERTFRFRTPIAKAPSTRGPNPAVSACDRAPRRQLGDANTSRCVAVLPPPSDRGARPLAPAVEIRTSGFRRASRTRGNR